MSAQLRVAIDVRYLSHSLVGGVHSYARNLVSQLLDDSGDQRYDLWVDAKATFELPSLGAESMVRVLPWHSQLSSVRNDLRLGRLMQRAGADVAHFPANYGLAPRALPTVITVHDAINLLPLREILRTHSHSPRDMTMMTYLHFMTRRAVARRPLVVTVSDYSRREIIKHSGLPGERVHVVHSAPDPAFRRLDDEAVRAVRARFGLDRRLILADAIKNPGCTLRAYRALPEQTRDQTSLVFFARRRPDDEVLKAHAEGECRLILRPELAELVALYNAADVFVLPSWYEGFGLPAIEAMACGTSVIVSSRGSLPEVVGDAGLVVDAEDHPAIAVEITQLIECEAYARERAELALQRAQQFTWERAARRMQELYRHAYEQHRHGLRDHAADAVAAR